jgi:hypothetical protein
MLVKRIARFNMLLAPGLFLLLWPPVVAQDTMAPGRPPDNHELITIKQGIWGNVWLWQGDFMPGPGRAKRGKVTAVCREVRIYKPTSMNMLEPLGGTNFTKVRSKLVKKVNSGKNGLFQVSLPPGQYSVFVKEDSTLYANWFDGQGDVLPVTVVRDSVTNFQINLTYGAVF